MNKVSNCKCSFLSLSFSVCRTSSAAYCTCSIRRASASFWVSVCRMTISTAASLASQRHLHSAHQLQQATTITTTVEWPLRDQHQEEKPLMWPLCPAQRDLWAVSSAARVACVHNYLITLFLLFCSHSGSYPVGDILCGMRGHVRLLASPQAACATPLPAQQLGRALLCGNSQLGTRKQACKPFPFSLTRQLTK